MTRPQYRLITADYAATLPTPVLAKLIDQVNTEEQRAAVRNELEKRG